MKRDYFEGRTTISPVGFAVTWRERAHGLGVIRVHNGVIRSLAVDDVAFVDLGDRPQPHTIPLDDLTPTGY